jgi:hypothetical protein
MAFIEHYEIACRVELLTLTVLILSGKEELCGRIYRLTETDVPSLPRNIFKSNVTYIPTARQRQGKRVVTGMGTV